MEIYFLRHGKAQGKDAWSGADADRPLSSEGAAGMERQAAVLSRLGVVPDTIIASPLVRARQTAEIVARQLSPSRAPRFDPRLAPGFGPADLERILKEHSGGSTLFLVGHEPDFSRTIGRCIGGGNVELKTGSLARVTMRDPASLSGTLSWLLPATVLAP